MEKINSCIEKYLLNNIPYPQLFNHLKSRLILGICKWVYIQGMILGEGTLRDGLKRDAMRNANVGGNEISRSRRIITNPRALRFEYIHLTSSLASE